MKQLKYSKQRESIKEYLLSTKTHPSAEEVYSAIRTKFPNISLATVYRNLNLLVELNEAKRITTNAEFDRFDGNLEPHYHFTCKFCNKVTDIFMSQFQEIDVEALQTVDGEIFYHDINFFGICKKCKSSIKQ